MLENFIISFKEFLYPFAEIAACTLELIGIIIIIVGSFRALIRLVNCLRKKLPFRVVIDLGKIFNEKNTLENNSIDIIELYKNGESIDEIKVKPSLRRILEIGAFDLFVGISRVGCGYKLKVDRL